MSRATHKGISITLPFEQLKVIDEFAELTGIGRSGVIQGFIQEALPTLQTVLVTLRQLHEIDAAHRAELSEKFDALQKQAELLEGEAGQVARAALAALHETKFSKV